MFICYKLQLRTELEAEHVYVLMKKEYRISRNIRAQWFFKKINTTVQLKERKCLSECTEELEVVSIVPRTHPDDWEPELSYLYEYKITPSTRVTFLSQKYHLVFCLDIGPSIAVVDIQNGEIMFDELTMALEKCLNGVAKPFLIPGSVYQFQPELCVTVVAHVPLLKLLTNHVLAQGWHVTTDNLHGFLEHVQSQLLEIEDSMAEHVASHQTIENYDEELDCSRSDPSQSDILLSHAISPDMNFVTLVQYGILSLQLVPENAISSIVIITNGIIGMPDMMTTESLLNQLRSGAISCSFLQVGSTYHPHCCLGYIPYLDLMQYIATATQGTYFSKIPNCEGFSPHINCFHEALFAWSFQRPVIANESQRSLPKISLNEWTTQNPYFYTSKEATTLRKRHLQGNIHTSLSALLSCRLREGYVVKDVCFKDNNHLQISFSLAWKHNVNLDYIISCQWPPLSTSQTWHIEVIIEGSYDFIRDFVYPMKKYQVSKNRVLIVKYFKLLLQGLQRTDQLLVHLHSFTSNSCHFTIPESIKKRMPLFTGSQNSTSPVPYASDCTHPTFLSFWKPMCSLDTSIWQKWLHVHKISLVLEYDHPLPNYLHLPADNGRYQNVQCRQALVALHALLTECSSFVLVENQSYIKFLYNDPGKPPISFYIIRVSSKTPCMSIRLAFLGGASGDIRNEVINKLKEEILSLPFQQRPVVKDTLVRKGLVSYALDRSVDGSLQTHLAQMGSSQLSCCTLFTKPLDKLLIRYEKVPSNYFILTPPKSASNNNNNNNEPANGVQRSPLVFPKSISSGNVVNTLFHYLHHHRWIWAVQGSNVPSVSSEAVGRILGALVKIRLNEGFMIAHSHYGMVNLVLEVEMKNLPRFINEEFEVSDLEQSKGGHKCVIQYILFPPHTTQSFRESFVSDEDVDVEMEPPEQEGELQIITESWVEPQDGVVINSRHKELEGLNYSELAKSFFPRDRECISTIVTFEHLSLLSRIQDSVLSAPFLPSPNSYNRSLASTIQHVPFAFDLIQFLPKCHQTELIFSTYIQCPSIDSTDAPNQLLMELLYDNLSTINDREVHLTSQDNRLFPFQVRDRQNPGLQGNVGPSKNTTDEVTSPNSAARTRKKSVSETAGSIPNWRCFVKALSSTHVILTFIPASFTDLKQFAHGRDQYSKLGLSRVKYVQDDSEVKQDVITKFCADGNFSPPDKNTEASNKNDQFGSIVLPIYVYDCSLTVLINQLVDRNEKNKSYDQCIDLTYKTKLETGEDTATLRSETHSSEESKQVSPEPRSEESYISSSTLKLKQHCNNIESVFSKCFVVGIFRSLHLGQEIHAVDVQTVVDGICTESLMEIDITNFIQTVCSHVRGFRVKTAVEQMKSAPLVATDAEKDEIDNDAGLGHTVCDEQTRQILKFPVLNLQSGNCEFNELIKNKFTLIFKKSFLPIPSKLDYFFYCLPNFQSFKWKTLLPDIGSIDVHEADIETFKPEMSEKGCASLLLMRNQSINDDQDLGVQADINSQMSVASNFDSESLISVADMNYCNDEIDDVVPPLFIHLMCTMKMKGNVRSCSVCCLPTCLGEILQCLENPVTELDLSDLHITLDIICLTLQSEIQSIIKRQNTTSFCSVSPPLMEPYLVHPDRAGSALSSPDDSYVNENHEVRSNLPDFQLQAVTKSMEEIKWMLRDEIASAMLEFYPLTEKTLDMVTSHVQSSPGRPGCVVEEVALQFVFGSEQSLDKFILQFKQMALTGYHVKQEGEFYYLATNYILPLKRASDASQKQHQQMTFANKFVVVQTTPHADDGTELRQKRSPSRMKPSDDTRQMMDAKYKESQKVSDMQNFEMDRNIELVVMSDADTRSLSAFPPKEDGEEIGQQKSAFGPYHRFASNSLSFTPGVSSDDVWSLIESGQCSTTEDGYDGDNSDVDIEGNDCASDLDMQTLQLPKFWLILKVLSDKVCVYFHARDTQENDEELQHWKDLYNQVIKNIKNICKLVNQTLLLQDLHDTRMCNQLLESETNEDIWRFDDYMFVRNKHSFDETKPDNMEYHDGYLKANLDFMPGAFACNVVWQMHFILHSRLKTGPGRTGMSRGVQAMRGILNAFSVNNRENMFVYAETSGSVFYLRLNESQCLSLSGSHTVFDSSSNTENLSAVSAKKSLTEEDEIHLHEARSRMNSLTDFAHDTVSLVSKVSVGKNKTEDSIQLLVHGITEAGVEIKEDLVQVLQNRLDEAVLDVIAVTLSRNPMCKLTAEDVQFIQKPNEPPKAIMQFTICSHAQQYLQALSCYLKQNLLQFLNMPKYIDAKPESHFQDYNPNCPESEALREGDAFLYNRPQGSGNKGIALIALSLVDGRQGNPVQHFSSPHPISLDHLETPSKSDFESLTFSQLYVASKQSTKLPGPWNLIQLRIWERGKIDLEQLTSRLLSAVRHALWDVVMEYRILVAPLNEGQFSEGPSFCSEPVTPIKDKKSFATQALSKKDRAPSPLTLVQLNHCVCKQVKFREFSSSVPDLIIKTRSPVASPKEPVSAFKLVGSPSTSTQKGSEIDASSMDVVDREKLHPIFATTIVDWMEFAIDLGVPTVWKHSLRLVSRYSVDFVLAELHSVLNTNANDTTLKAFRKVKVQGEDIYLPHTISLSVLKQREKRVDHGSDSAQKAPGKSNDFILIGRDTKQWRTSINYLYDDSWSETSSLHAIMHRNDQRFPSIVVNNDQSDRGESTSCPATALPINAVVTPGAVSFSGVSLAGGGSPDGNATVFIPRQKLLLVAVYDKVIDIYGYNWSSELVNKLQKQTSRLVQWNNARSKLLTNIVLQKMGLFHETAARKPDKDILKASEIDLFKLTSPPTRDTQPFPLRRQSSSRSNVNIENVFRDTQPSRPVHKTPYNHIKDPVLKHSQQVQELRNAGKKVEQQKKLSNLFHNSPTHNNPSLKEESLQLLKHSSRIEHYCLTPLLFLPQWRLKVAGARDYTIPSFSQTGIVESRPRIESEVPMKFFDRRKSITLPIGNSAYSSPLLIRLSNDEYWHTPLSISYVHEFIQYLQNLGFVPLQLRSNDKKNGNEESGGLNLINNKCHVQKSLIGGSIIILELSISEPYFSVWMYCLEARRIYPDRTKNLQFTSTFVDECDKLKTLIHLHSFTYDYHLRSIHAYISGRQFIFRQGYHLTSFLEDFVRYYQKSPNFSWNLVSQGILISDNTTTPAYLVYDHLLNHDKLYGMRVLRMVPFVQDHDQDVDNEYVLVQISHKKVSYKDGNEMRRTDDFDISLLISHDKTPRDDSDQFTLVLKYFIILTSRRELYPRAVVDKKLGKFRTVATASPIPSRKVSTTSIDKVDLAKLDNAPSRKVSSTDSVKVEEVFADALECLEDAPTDIIDKYRTDSLTDSENCSVAQSPTVTHRLGRSQTSIRQESVNYLGYFSTNEELMNQIMQEQIEAAKSNLTMILDSAIIHCRRDSLWKRLLIGVRDNEDRKKREDPKELMNLGVNFTEFTELLTHVVVQRLNDIDRNLNQLFNMHISWYQGLAKVLINSNPEMHRLFVDSDGAVQHVVVFNDNYKHDMCILLSVESQANKASLNVIHRVSVPKSEPNPEKPSYHSLGVQTLVEDFVNACCYHLWTGILIQNGLIKWKICLKMTDTMDLVSTIEITPPQKSITDSPSSLDGPRDFSEAIAASFEVLGDPAAVNACISLIKSECHAQEMKKSRLVELSMVCDAISNCSDDEQVKEMSYDLNSPANSYILRIDTDQPADGVYVAACVNLTDDDDANESSKSALSVLKEFEKGGKCSWKSDAVEVDRPEEDSQMANLISQDITTNGYLSNGHHPTEDTDEDLSSTSEVDSLELNKSVSQQAAFFKSLSMTDVKVNGFDAVVEKSQRETVIEREIRLQKEREEAVAKERRDAQMAVILKQNGQENSISGDSIDSQHDLDICDKELNGFDSLDRESVESDIILAPKKYVKVRPVVEDDDDVPVYRVLKESPVEREIRQSLEREAELKREKGLVLVEGNLPETPVSPQPLIIDTDTKSNPSTFPSIKSRTLDLLTPRSERSVQKKLATSRIQQEIEEQTQRELKLRAEGAIKNTSEDFVDGWVLGRINPLVVDVSPVENTLVSPPSLPSTPDSELTDGVFSSPATTPSPVTTNGVAKTNGVKLFVKKTNGITSLPRPNGVKGVMAKFLSSRGKIVPTVGNRPKSGSITSFDGDEFIREQLMDEIRKPPPKNFRRSYCSAESKIQAELQQMKAREEELRLVRAKQMALSQPNLSNIGIGDDENDVNYEVETNRLNGFKEMLRANSNPNLLEDNSESSEEQVMKTRVTRRRTPLIDQWERLAQQNNDN
uniref:A-kinase anchor protein 2 C-terminal domain-containing protein n=1 Tax=Strigamia maritima TaxID=126957 RepID=T1IR37_STRMM